VVPGHEVALDALRTLRMAAMKWSTVLESCPADQIRANSVRPIPIWDHHLLLIAAMAFLVNSRHLLMGAALAPWLERLPRRKALPALFILCDESWAMGFTDAGRAARRPASSRSSACPTTPAWRPGLYPTSIVAAAAGAALGPLFGNVEVYGFDLAFPAVFLVLLRGT